MSDLPAGTVALDHFAAMKEPLAGNRTQRFTYELLDTSGVSKGPLEGVTGGQLQWHSNAAVHGGGKITVVQKSRFAHNWLQRRVKVWMNIEDMGRYPLGVYVCAAPSETWDDTVLTLDVELLDKCSVLDNDYVESTYTLDAGTVITTAVRSLITSTGEEAGSITTGPEALDKAMTWEAGESKLAIVNDLLAAGNYFSLRVDGNGNFRVEKQRLPSTRPVSHEFRDNFQSIYAPSYSYEKDIYSVPNKVIMIGQGSGDEEAKVSVATNMNPNSPYSYQSRGRWITDVTKGVEAVDQEALDGKAAHRLVQLTSPTGKVTIDHAPLPWLGVDDVVLFHSETADIDVRAIVQSTQIDLDPLALQRTELQEVAEL